MRGPKSSHERLGVLQMRKWLKQLATAGSAASLVLLAACGGGADDAAPTYTVAGEVVDADSADPLPDVVLDFGEAADPVETDLAG